LQPSDADLKKYYDDNIAHYRTDGQVRASHILIAAPKDASAADKAKAKAEGRRVARTDQGASGPVRADRAAELAGSGFGVEGRRSGLLRRGMIAGGQAFDDAVFGLKKDEVSGIVQTDFGYHIVKVTDVKPAVTKPFDEVKDQIAKT
jgi:Parvulin-like peptidyl-prolyl isomerase